MLCAAMGRRGSLGDFLFMPGTPVYGFAVCVWARGVVECRVRRKFVALRATLPFSVTFSVHCSPFETTSEACAASECAEQRLGSRGTSWCSLSLVRAIHT